MPLTDMVKPLKANTIAIARTSPPLLGAGFCSWSSREASATLAAELASGRAAEATGPPRPQQTHPQRTNGHRVRSEPWPKPDTAFSEKRYAICYRWDTVQLIDFAQQRPLADHSQSEDVEGRKFRTYSDAVPEIDREAEVSGPQRKFHLTVFLHCAIALVDRVHCKLACTIQPSVVAGARMEFQEGVAAPGCAVAQAGEFDRRPTVPHQFTCLLQ